VELFHTIPIYLISWKPFSLWILIMDSCELDFNKYLFVLYLYIELLKKKKAPGLAKGRKFKKNSDFWMYEKKIRFWIRKTIKKQWFYWFVILLVFFNTCSVAVEHYDQPSWLSGFLGLFSLCDKDLFRFMHVGKMKIHN